MKRFVITSFAALPLRKCQKGRLCNHLRGVHSDASVQGLHVLQGEPIDGVWESESMVDEAGRRQDSAYAYLRPVMGPGGVPSLLFHTSGPVLAYELYCLHNTFRCVSAYATGHKEWRRG
jgi:hypothetical protein